MIDLNFLLKAYFRYKNLIKLNVSKFEDWKIFFYEKTIFEIVDKKIYIYCLS